MLSLSLWAKFSGTALAVNKDTQKPETERKRMREKERGSGERKTERGRGREREGKKRERERMLLGSGVVKDPPSQAPPRHVSPRSHSLCSVREANIPRAWFHGGSLHLPCSLPTPALQLSTHPPR